MKNIQSGFTLVELIITITILAILGTIAFISLQGYSESARNSLRIDHMGKLASAIDNKKIIGTNLLGLSFTGSEVENAQIAGTGAIVGSNYKAGDYNEFALGVQNDQFRDPLSEDMYKIGVTSQRNGSFEVVGTIEDASGEKSKVIGRYTPRIQELISGKSSIGSYRVTLENYEKIGSFFPGDVLTGSLVSPNTTIQSISRDGTILVLNSATIAGDGNIALASNEVEGLVSGVGGSAVVNLGVDVPYFVGTGGGFSSSSSSGGSGGGGSGSGGGGGGATAGPAGAQSPILTWVAMLGDTSMSPPESDNYNNFSTNLAASNSNIVIEVGNQNVTIDTRFGDDTVTTGYGNSDIDISGGNNIVSVGDGFNEIFIGSSGNNNLTIGHGDNYIQTDGGNITVVGGEGDNEFLLGYGNIVDITLGNGNNIINGTAGGNFEITLGDGNNTISPGGFGNHNITLGNGINTLSGVGGSSIVTTGTGGTAEITFGGNQAQRLVWRGGNVTVNDYWRWGNNRVSFENITDINNCTNLTNNTVMSGSEATITSSEGILIINIQEGQTDLNCGTNMIF